MKYFLIVSLFLCAFMMVACDNSQIADIQPPKAKIEPKELSIHGDVRTDNYFWLRDDSRENEEVLNYLRAENGYLQKVMAHTEDLQEELFSEFKNRLKEDDSSVPYKEGNYFYFARYETGKEYPLYARKFESLDAEEEIILDVNTIAEGHNFFSARNLRVSTNEEILGYAVDTVGRRKYTIKFKNLTNGELLENEIPDVTGSFVWANDNNTIFYSKQDPDTLRSYQIYRYQLDTGESELVYQENDVEFSARLGKSKSKKYIFINCSQTLSTELLFIDADNPAGAFTVFQPREENHEYQVDHVGGSFYIRTNKDALNFKLMKTPETATTADNWTEVIPHREDVFLSSFELFNDYVVLSERKDGLRQLHVLTWNGNEDYYIDFGEPTYVSYIDVNVDPASTVLRYSYQSLKTPASVFDFDMVTKEKTLLKQDEVKDYDASLYTSERQFVLARDGETKIPLSIVYKKDLFKKDGSNPGFMYGYGSYGYSTDPSFRSTVISLLNRGFVYAIAHVRGGQEMGREWYEDGKLLTKKNTFTDFNDCAKFLAAEKYSSHDKLFAMGGSAGGLLMGAIVNMEPELYKGIIAHVPWVDVVTTMLDESIPLTTSEFDEWGNPKDVTFYKYMLSYSPYDNVKAQDYPNMLVTTGLWDSQVQYWEPAKWVAKLRTMKTDDNLLLFKTDMEAGHGGTTGRYKRLRDTALEYAFILEVLK